MQEVEDKYIVFFTRNENVVDSYMGKRVVMVSDLENFRESLVADSHGFGIDSNFIDSTNALDVETDLMALIKAKHDVTLIGFVGPKVFQQHATNKCQILLNTSTGNCFHYDSEYLIPPDVVKVFGPEIITNEVERVSATLYFHNLCEGTEADTYLLRYQMKYDNESGYLISAKSIVGDFKMISYQLLKLKQELPIGSEVCLSLVTNASIGKDGLVSFQGQDSESTEVYTGSTKGYVSVNFRDKD